jgi:tetracycline 7-halogenase / FADH2 O2-dependent halogenase
MRIQTDLAIVGSGFGGSLAALIARRLGLSVALLEKGSHPRFAIGESSSPLANLLLESLADRYGLERVRPLAKWGTWRRAYPEVCCGLKRGFTFYSHPSALPFGRDPDRRDQLLVAASPRDEIADTHWYRPDFDHFLVREAEAAGAQYFDRTRLDRIEASPATVLVEGEREGRPLSIRSRLLVDASGPRGFLCRALAIPESRFPGFPATCALYTHFRDVSRIAAPGTDPSGEEPPYPPDDAALHHVFPGGWIWVLRFANGVTSAGVAATQTLGAELRFSEGEPAWERLLARLPTVADQFAGARPVLPFVYQPDLPFRASRAHGPGWTLLPSAAGFVDPLLSTGFPLTLLGIERLGRALEEDWGSARLPGRLETDGQRALFEVDTAARLVGALYSSFSDFPLFSALSKLYFAAASFSEAARRLGRPELAGSFLSADRPVFGAAFAECCRRALEDSRDEASRGELLVRIRAAIEPLDVAGLSDETRRNWHPVRAQDLLEGAGKLGASRGEVESLLVRSGFFAEPGSGTPPADLRNANTEEMHLHHGAGGQG